VYPKYGNLVPRDVATRAIFKVVYEHNLGIDGKPMVYLDLTHIDRKILDKKLEGILEIYEKFVGDDPRDTPMKIFPGMHYTMGGLWVDFKQSRTSPASSLPAKPSTSTMARTVWVRTPWSPASSEASSQARTPCNTPRPAEDRSQRPLRSERKRQEEINDGLMKADGSENPFKLWQELGDEMTRTARSSATTKTSASATPSWSSYWNACRRST